MSAKTEEEAGNGAKSAATAEPAAKAPAADGQAGGTAAAQGAATPPPSFDAVFNSYFTHLYRAVKEIRKELRDVREAATSNNNAPAASAGEGASGAGLSEGLVKSLHAKLETFEKILSGGSGGDNEFRKAIDELGGKQSSVSNQAVEQLEKNVRKDLHDVVKVMIDFRQLVDARLTKMEDAVKGAAQAPASVAAPVAVQVRPQPTPPSFPSAEIDDDQWKEIILGVELCGDPALSESRNRLFRGILSEDDSAKALAGQMLLVQAATPDRLPPLMKEVGEAYYRWRPKMAGMADPFETALAGFLKRRCDAGGLGNTIELVIVGDRFDAAKHNASERGATITGVHGWVVLRDNGKVYTKANVSVK